jgi:hypothetical protein
MHVVFQTAVSCGESQLISIPPMHVVFQTAVRFGGSQLIRRETRVSNLGDFSPKNANLGTFGSREIFRGILKSIFKKWFNKILYMRFSGPKQNIPHYFKVIFRNYIYILGKISMLFEVTIGIVGEF